MLARAARRRHALRYVEHTTEKLQLPWLYSPLNTLHPSNTQRRTTSSRPTLLRSHRLAWTNPPTRHLASAISVPDDYHDDEYLPFSYSQAATTTTSRYKEPMVRNDLNHLLIIDQTTALPSLRPSAFRSSDIRANLFEIENTLDACLQVQKWDRAFYILEQLSRSYIGNSGKLRQLHNKVLEAMVFDLIYNRNTQNKDKIGKWVEVYMANAGVKPDAQTMALKIKVALATMHGSQRDRTVRRYFKLLDACSTETQTEIASMRHLFSDHELGRLFEICPSEFDSVFELDTDEVLQNDIPQEVNVSPTNSASIRETEQKGLGLVSLRQALASFKNFDQVTSGQEHDEEHDTRTRLRQSQLEQDSLQSAVDRWKVEHEKRLKMGVSGSMEHGKLGALTWQWHEMLTKKIEQELQLVEKTEAASKQSTEDRLRCEYGPFLRLLKPQHLAALTTIAVVQTMTKQGISKSTRLAFLVTRIGRTVEEEIASQKKIKKTKVTKPGNSNADKSHPDGSSHVSILHTPALSENMHWSNVTAAKVGAILCELLFDVARMAVTMQDPNTKKMSTLAEPVFQRQTKYVHGRKVTAVSTHPAFADLLSKQPPAELIAKQLPMISRPKQWTAYSDGGYLESTQPVLRVKFEDIAQRDYAKAAAERGDLDQIFAGLDVLGSTGWKINRDVFNVMLEAWNSGEAVANLPPADKVFPNIAKPADSASPTEKWQYFSKLRAIENEKGGLHSNRCFQNFQMEIARSYLKETFYLPHNVDFRGRAYPIPPYLNQMGADNARGLLLFATGKELGPDGLRWIQIHLANVFGYDKASLTDRAQFSLDHIEDIRDSVDNPLTGKRWWLKAEDPWQCLATCHELVRALDCSDPTKYVSHLPVHQDGTCNGLQHYAALGGDVAGARQVNLLPGDKPADVYTGVAELVKAEIKHDAENGLEIAQKLQDRITRKIVKQTVMTNVYGVTFTGAIRQVRKQVDDILPDLNESGHAAQAATYIARKIFKGLGTLFEGAHEIQYWLGDCANRITYSISPAQLEQLEQKEFGNAKICEKNSGSVPKRKKKVEKTIDTADFRSTVVWTTPLGLPVVQPYRISHAETVQTSLQGLCLTQPNAADAVDQRKQLQAFPPNFVHSLDATHMMLSAMEARKLGLTFSAVHDSFWTHAADIKTLNVLLRETFIRMHSEDVITRLAAEFRTRYKGHWYLAKIGRQNTLAKKILAYRSSLKESKADSKQQRYKELVREIKRTRLLASEDPAERAEGEAMITAAALFEKYDGQRYLPSKVSLGQTAIGEDPGVDPLSVENALQAHVDADIDMEHTLDSLLDAEAEAEATEEVNHKAPGKKSKDPSTVWLWLPLAFRDVPRKGMFDIKMLRDSTYFFS